MEKRLTLEEIKELKKSAKTLGFSFVMEEMLSDDDLRERFATVYDLEIDDPKRYEIMEEACLDLAMQYEDPKELEYLAVNVVDADLHESLAKAIIRNQAKLNCHLEPDQIANIAFSVESQSFLRECIDRHEEYNIDQFGLNLLESALLYYSAEFIDEEPSAEELIEMERFVEELEKESSGEAFTDEEERRLKWMDAHAGFAKGYYEPLDDRDYEVDRPLDYSAAERFAIKIYEGVCPGRGSLGSDMTAYKTINAMNYPGISNELERIFDDKTVINPSAIFQTEELMQKSLDLYSVMYKYGKRMARDRKGFRVDRASSARLTYETGKVVSNFSTSTTGYKNFSKADIALEEVIIRKGTPCADFREILGAKDYELSTESEILVAPGAIVVSKEPRLPETPEELRMKNKSFKPASAVYEMTISAPEKPQELTQEEEEDLFENSMIAFNEESRRKAAMFIAKLQDLSHQGYSKEDALKIIDQDDMAEYLRWKEAFQKVYKYRTRQIALEIERKVELAKQNGEPLFTLNIPVYDEEELEGETETGKKTINMEEIEEMIASKSLTDSTEKVKKLLDFLDQVKQGKKGIQNIELKDDERDDE